MGRWGPWPFLEAVGSERERCSWGGTTSVRVQFGGEGEGVLGAVHSRCPWYLEFAGQPSFHVYSVFLFTKSFLPSVTAEHLLCAGSVLCAGELAAKRWAGSLPSRIFPSSMVRKSRSTL